MEQPGPEPATNAAEGERVLSGPGGDGLGAPSLSFHPR